MAEGNGREARVLVAAGVAAILISTFAAYIPAIRGGFVWDDDLWVTENPLLSAPDGLWRIWFSTDQPSQYFPLVYTTFRIEHGLWGLNPAGYHTTNVALHAINALLLWWLLRRLRIPGAWLASAVFALHPVHVESVAWITERKNVLLLCFSLLSLLAWLRFVRSASRPHWRWYALSLALYVLALFSKTTACTLPAALVLILWLERVRVDARRRLQIAPYVALGLAGGLLTMWFERFKQGMDPTLLELTWIDRGLVASHAIWFYLGKLLWPVNLAFSYPRWELDASGLVWVVLSLAAVVAMAFWRDRIGRGPIAAMVFFVATLTPTLGLILLVTFFYSYAADHYQYVASIGPIALVAALLARAAARMGVAGRRALALGSIAVLGLLGSLTWRQAAAYESPETLWRDTLSKNPDSWLAHNNLGTELNAQGKHEESIEHYLAALRLSRDLPGSGARIHYNLGNAFRTAGDLDRAAEHYTAAIEQDPGHVLAGNNLGNILMLQGRLQEAIARHERTLEIDPAYPDAHTNLANALVLSGEIGRAVEHYEQAIRLRPGEVPARLLLARLLTGQGRFDQALGLFTEAIRLQPGNADALNGAAWILANHPDPASRNTPRAVELAERAATASGRSDPTALYTLSLALAANGQRAAAIETAKQALRIAETQGKTGLAGQLRTMIGSAEDHAAAGDQRRRSSRE